MRRYTKYSAAIVVSLCLAGCASHRVHWDATQLRERAIEYYTTQVVDNLIRGKNGQLILHANISTLNAVVGSKAAGSIGGGDTVTKGNELDALGVLTKATRSVANPFTFSLSPEVNNSLTFTAVPEVNDPDLYELYIKFLNLKTGDALLESADGARVNVSDPNAIVSILEKPTGVKLEETDYVVGTLRKWRGRVYYVPSAFQQAYFDLCLGLMGRVVKGTSPAVAGVPQVQMDRPNQLPLKYDSRELRTLQRLQQQLDSAPLP